MKKYLNFILIFLISNFLVLLFFYIFKYSYITHLLIEFFIIFLQLSLFLILIVLPRSRITPLIEILGMACLSGGILDIFHTIYYPGGPSNISNIQLSVAYWMLARLIQSVSFFTSIFFIKYKTIRWKLLYFNMITITIIAIFLPHYLPKNIFYVEGIGTTILKNMLETIYGLLFISSAIYLIRYPYIFFGRLSLGLSEFCFIGYITAFEPIMWLGHSLQFTGFLLIAIFRYKEFLFEPLKSIKEIEEKYIKEDIESKVNLKEITELIELNLKIRDEIIKYQDLDSIYKTIEKYYSNYFKSIPFALFENKNLIYKNVSELPNNYFEYNNSNEFNKLDFDELTIFSTKIDDKIKENILLTLFKFILLYIKKLKLIDELEKTKSELIKVDEYRKFFIRSFSHDIRTPLNVVYGYVQLLLSGFYGEISKDILEIFNNINFSLKNALNFVEDILNLTKLETGDLKLKIKEINIKNLFNNIIYELNHLAKEKELYLNHKFIGKEIVFTDEYAIKSILTNLISNSIKFTNTGGVDVLVEVKEDEIIINVKDTGVGIEKDKIKDIFKPFVKLTENGRGFGLGLSLVKHYVDLLNGTINVESEVGKGSIFVVTIPIRIIETKEIEFKEKKDILIIDENELTRIYLKNILRKYNIIEASNYKEGIIKAYESYPNIMIIHYNLPELNGLELIRYFKTKEEFKDTKFILFTVSKEIETDEAIIIDKGTNPNDILEIINNLIGGKS